MPRYYRRRRRETSLTEFAISAMFCIGLVTVGPSIADHYAKKLTAQMTASLAQPQG